MHFGVKGNKMYEILGSHGESFDTFCLWDVVPRLTWHKVSE